MLARTLGCCPRWVLVPGTDDGLAAPFLPFFEFDETVNPYVRSPGALFLCQCSVLVLRPPLHSVMREPPECGTDDTVNLARNGPPTSASQNHSSLDGFFRRCRAKIALGLQLMPASSAFAVEPVVKGGDTEPPQFADVQQPLHSRRWNRRVMQRWPSALHP